MWSIFTEYSNVADSYPGNPLDDFSPAREPRSYVASCENMALTWWVHASQAEVATLEAFA